MTDSAIASRGGIARASGRSTLSGFSTRTCSPRCTACTNGARPSGGGVARQTASTPPPSRSPPSGRRPPPAAHRARRLPHPSANASARPRVRLRDGHDRHAWQPPERGGVGVPRPAGPQDPDPQCRRRRHPDLLTPRRSLSFARHAGQPWYPRVGGRRPPGEARRARGRGAEDRPSNVTEHAPSLEAALRFMVVAVSVEPRAPRRPLTASGWRRGAGSVRRGRGPGGRGLGQSGEAFA